MYLQVNLCQLVNSNLSECDMTLRNKLIDIALQWQESFGVAPSITSALSEYDAAMSVAVGTGS